MNEGAGTPRLFEFEAFGAAVGSAVVCGALSVPVPILIAPTATLTALAVAGWLSPARRRGSLTRSTFGPALVAALTVLGGASAGFLAPPWFLSPYRGLILAGSLVPLFVVGRDRRAFRTPVFSRS
jgi:hypothetical protein